MRTVVHLQLGEDARHIVAYGVLAEHEAACDVPIAVALSDQLEDLALALGKFRELGRGEGPPGGREVLHDTRGDGRPEYGPALADPADRAEYVGAVGVLEDVAPRTGTHGREDRRVILKHAHDQYAYARIRGQDPSGGLDAATSRHLNVHENEVRN